MGTICPSTDVHRLAMCHRMARLTGQGKVSLDLSPERISYKMESSGIARTFHTLESMETYLEDIMYERYRGKNLGRMDIPLKLRMNTIAARQKGGIVVLSSRINSGHGKENKVLQQR